MATLALKMIFPQITYFGKLKKSEPNCLQRRRAGNERKDKAQSCDGPVLSLRTYIKQNKRPIRIGLGMGASGRQVPEYGKRVGCHKGLGLGQIQDRSYTKPIWVGGP
jgi:hypothetical protein